MKGGWHFLQGAAEAGTCLAVLPGFGGRLLSQAPGKRWLRLWESFRAIHLILFEKSLVQVVISVTAQNKTNSRPPLLLVSLRTPRRQRGGRIAELGRDSEPQHPGRGPGKMAVGIKTEERKNPTRVR